MWRHFCLYFVSLRLKVIFKEKLFKKLVDDLYEKGKAINAASLLEFDTVLDPIESRDWISMVAESPIDSSEKVPKNRYIDSW